jgi:hypothetical protein
MPACLLPDTQMQQTYGFIATFPIPEAVRHAIDNPWPATEEFVCTASPDIPFVVPTIKEFWMPDRVREATVAPDWPCACSLRLPTADRESEQLHGRLTERLASRPAPGCHTPRPRTGFRGIPSGVGEVGARNKPGNTGRRGSFRAFEYRRRFYSVKSACTDCTRKGRCSHRRLPLQRVSGLRQRRQRPRSQIAGTRSSVF